jgi:hypothetical protein
MSSNVVCVHSVGFGENCRVLKWICERVDGIGKARSTPIGLVPTHDALDLGILPLFLLIVFIYLFIYLFIF